MIYVEGFINTKIILLKTHLQTDTALNPEWKEIVNECGFVRDSSLRSE